LLATHPAPDGRQIWYLVDSHPVIRGTDLRDARVGIDNPRQPVTTFILSQDAATLVIGLITNLFTSIFVSRVAFDWELSRPNGTKELSIGLAH
jgi:preprotein translocase subunit SecD